MVVADSVAVVDIIAAVVSQPRLMVVADIVVVGGADTVDIVVVSQPRYICC